VLGCCALLCFVCGLLAERMGCIDFDAFDMGVGGAAALDARVDLVKVVDDTEVGATGCIFCFLKYPREC